MRTKTKTLALACCAVALLLAADALAFNPGTDSRAKDTAELVTPVQTRFCEGGPNEGNTCVNADPDCLFPAGTCSGVNGITIAARGLLTLITDTIDPNTGWDETAPTGACTEPTPGNTSSCEGTGTSTLTVVLEFSLNGQKYLFAQTHKDLPNGFEVQPAGYEGWVQPAVESIVTERAAVAGTDTLRIRWGVLSPAVESDVRTVLGGVAAQRVTLSSVDEVPICTNATFCNSTVFQDQAGATEVQASVRRFKVDIALVNPGP